MVKMSNFTDGRQISKLHNGRKAEIKLGKLCKKLSIEREKGVCLDLFLPQEKGTVIRNLYKGEWILSLWKFKNNGNDLFLILLAV